MNAVKTLFLLMVLSGLLLMIGGIFGGEGGLMVALIFALIMNVGAYWFSDRIALGMTHAKPVTEEEDPELYSIVAEQASLAGLPMPKVYEIESDSPNAFATGRNPNHATVAATTGIRRILSRDELGAVMAHEMAHVGNRDTLIMAVVATIAGAISMLAFMAQISAMFGRDGRPGPRRRRTDRLAGGRHRDAPGCSPGPRCNFPHQGVPGRRHRRQDLRKPLRTGQRIGKAGNGSALPPDEGCRGRFPPVYRQPPEREVHGQPFFDPPAHGGTDSPVAEHQA